jgi:alpha/beta hydrolase fold
MNRSRGQAGAVSALLDEHADSTGGSDGLAGVLVASLRLRPRFDRGLLQTRIYWPPTIAADASSSLVLFLASGEPYGAERAHFLSRELSLAAGVVAVTLADPCVDDSDGSGHGYEIAALEWSADHARELGADPGRLVVAGLEVGGACAAWLALAVRDNGWPALGRQVLVHPRFTEQRPPPLRVAGVVPATVVTPGGPNDDGTRYAARLRRSGIEVIELCHPQSVPGRQHEEARLVADLARSLCPLPAAGASLTPAKGLSS